MDFNEIINLFVDFFKGFEKLFSGEPSFFKLLIIGALAFVIISTVYTFLSRVGTKSKFKSFDNNFYKIRKGMTKHEVRRTLGVDPIRMTANTLVFEKKLKGYGSLSDHETTTYEFYFNEDGLLYDYREYESYKKTTTRYY